MNATKREFSSFASMTTKGAEREGFAVFNGGEHLCVDVPDDNFTISARTSSGKRITFAFCPYEKNGEPMCVDVQYHDGGKKAMNGSREIPVQNVINWTTGHAAFRSNYDAEKPVTLLTVILDGVEGP